jgi:2-isopropylmalate synthase
MFARIRLLVERVPNMDRAVLSTHCHDDLGLAVANSLAAVAAGCGQIECTINGIGERAGNCALEEVVMAMRTRHDLFHCTTGIQTQRLVPVSRLLSKITGMEVQRNKAIVGRNAFAHESGIHQDGMLKERSTYEIMRPEDVGLAKTDLVLGKHSGRAALADRARALGFNVTAEQLQTVFEKFKELADKKKDVYDGDIVALIQNVISGEVEQAWTLVRFEASSGTGRSPRVSLTLAHDGKEFSQTVEQGDGPVDAAFWAVERITGLKVVCKDYRVRSATLGRDALGEVQLEIEHEGQTVKGVGVSTDTVESTILAMLNAINRIATVKSAAARLTPLDA